MKRKQTYSIYSIFGQIEGAVADDMATRDNVKRIEARDVPAIERFNNDGVACHCALVMNADQLAEFNKRVAALRA